MDFGSVEVQRLMYHIDSCLATAASSLLAPASPNQRPVLRIMSSITGSAFDWNKLQKTVEVMGFVEKVVAREVTLKNGGEVRSPPSVPVRRARVWTRVRVPMT